MGNKERIGIMGGTFNPIHFAHLLLAETARDVFGLDKVLFVPSGNSYMKEGMDIAAAKHRLEMTRLAILDNPSFCLSSIEVDRPGDSYTYETLKSLKEAHPDQELYFILGADCLFMIENWKYPQIIFENCIILAAVREDKDLTQLKTKCLYLCSKFHGKIELLPMKEIGISSTDIRNKIKTGGSIRYLVPQKVIAYMEQHHIYC